MTTHIVKRHGHKQEFDSRKIYGAVYSSCLNAHLTKIEAEKIAEALQMHMEKWVKDKREITSQEIFEEVATAMRSFHEDAAFLYATHRDIA
ncbi:MAG: ATP cone domain-containing protein [bacterium]|nr:ATP cone domain-containing protein [bacterium]